MSVAAVGRHAHGAPGRKRPTLPQLTDLKGRRPSVPLIIIIVMVIGAIVLGVWWWNLRHAADPIDANPVDASAVVVSSPACADGSDTKVRIPLEDTNKDAVATISACGFIADQRVAVQYLEGHPDQARLAGTATSGSSSAVRTVLPYLILAAALVAMIAAVRLLTGRRDSRPSAARRSRRRGAAGPGPGTVSVAELRARMEASRESGSSGPSGQSGSPGPSGQSGSSGPSGQSGSPAPSGQSGSPGPSGPPDDDRVPHWTTGR